MGGRQGNELYSGAVQSMYSIVVQAKSKHPEEIEMSKHKQLRMTMIEQSLLLLPDTSFPFLQGLLARVLGLWLIDLLEHHKIDSMLSVYQFILKKYGL